MDLDISVAAITQFNTAPFGAATRLFQSAGLALNYVIPYEPFISKDDDLVLVKYGSEHHSTERFFYPLEEAALFDAIISFQMIDPTTSRCPSGLATPDDWRVYLRGSNRLEGWPAADQQTVATDACVKLINFCRTEFQSTNWRKRRIAASTSELTLRGAISLRSLVSHEAESKDKLRARFLEVLGSKLLTASIKRLEATSTYEQGFVGYP